MPERVTTGSEPRRCRTCGLENPGPEHRANEPLLCSDRPAKAVESGHDEQTEELKARLLEAEAELLAVRIERDTAHDALREARAVLDNLLDHRDDYPTDLTPASKGWTEGWKRARGVLEKGDGAQETARG